MITLAVALGATLLTLQTAAQGRPPRTIHVPADYSRIQQAIDSARTGDTVLVAPGHYYENLRLKGRNIVLASEFLTTHDTSLIARTILDGSRPLRLPPPMAGRGGGLSVRDAAAVMRDNIIRDNTPNDVEEVPR